MAILQKLRRQAGATRGNVPAPAPGTQWGSLIKAPVTMHSAKPEVVYDLIVGKYTPPKWDFQIELVRHAADPIQALGPSPTGC